MRTAVAAAVGLAALAIAGGALAADIGANDDTGKYAADAGAVFFGMSRNSSYEAAKTGDIPTVRIGGRVLALVAPIAAKLGLTTNFGASREKQEVAS